MPRKWASKTTKFCGLSAVNPELLRHSVPKGKSHRGPSLVSPPPIQYNPIVNPWFVGGRLSPNLNTCPCPCIIHTIYSPSILARPAQSKLTCMHSTHDNNRGGVGKGCWILPYHWDIWANDQQSCPYMLFRSCISPSHTKFSRIDVASCKWAKAL